MKKTFLISLFLFYVAVSSCDTVDDTDYLIPSITIDEAWLSEADAWEAESLGRLTISKSFDSLSTILESEGSNYKYWDSLSVIISDLNEAIVWADNLSQLHADSSQYFLDRSIDSEKFINIDCFPDPASRRNMANDREAQIKRLHSSVNDFVWMPNRDSIDYRLSDSSVAWVISANNWHKLWQRYRAAGWRDIPETCTVDLLSADS